MGKYKKGGFNPLTIPPHSPAVSLRKVKFCRNPETTADTLVIINIQKILKSMSNKITEKGQILPNSHKKNLKRYEQKEEEEKGQILPQPRNNGRYIFHHRHSFCHPIFHIDISCNFLDISNWC